MDKHLVETPSAPWLSLATLDTIRLLCEITLMLAASAGIGWGVAVVVWWLVPIK